MDKLLAARQCLSDTLEASHSLSSQFHKTESNLECISQNLSVLSTELRATNTRKTTLFSVGEHVDWAVGPVAAVLKIYDSVNKLEQSLVSEAKEGDTIAYLSLIKQFEEALRFLSDNCGLAVQWIQDIVKLLDENVMADDQYVLNVKRSLRILMELKATEARARLNGGILTASFRQLESKFRILVKESPASHIHEIHAIIERLKDNNRIENCQIIFVDVRTLKAREALHTLHLSYLDTEISENDSVQKLDDHIVNWSKHMEFALKQILQTEYELCNGVFERFGSDIYLSCFSKITYQSGFLSLIEFGNRITETKKDAVKLLKLLEVFAVLEKLRVDFNILFSSKQCLGIQNLTRDLVKRVVDGACGIFKDLSVQVDLQRYNMNLPPLDGGVPRLVTFVTNYCVVLLEDDYRLSLSSALSIHEIWNNRKKPQESILRKEFCKIIKAIEINLETWSKTFDDAALAYFFLMNNYRYLHEFTQGTVFGDFMGGTWSSGYQKKMEKYTEAYLKESWGKLPGILSEEGLILFSPGRSTTQELVRNRIREFNEAFEEMYIKQSAWNLSDDGMRERACQVIVQTVVPTYRFYLHNYGYLENGSSPSRYVKYSVASLEAMLRSLFQHKMSKLGRSSSTKSTHLMSKLRSAFTNQLRVAPIST